MRPNRLLKICKIQQVASAATVVTLLLMAAPAAALHFPPGEALTSSLQKQKDFSRSQSNLSRLAELQEERVGPMWQPDVTLSNQTRMDIGPDGFARDEQERLVTNSALLDFQWNLYDGGLETKRLELSRKELKSKSLQVKDLLQRSTAETGGLILSLILHNALEEQAKRQVTTRKTALDEMNTLISRGARPQQENAEQEILLFQAQERLEKIQKQKDLLFNAIKQRSAAGLIESWRQYFAGKWLEVKSQENSWAICSDPNPAVYDIADERLELQTALLRDRINVAELQENARPTLDLQVGVGAQIAREGAITRDQFIALQFQWKLFERSPQFDSAFEIAEELALVESQRNLQKTDTSQRFVSACTRLKQTSRSVDFKAKILRSEKSLLKTTHKKYRLGAIGDFEWLSRQLSLSAAEESLLNSQGNERLAFFQVWLMSEFFSQ